MAKTILATVIGGLMLAGILAAIKLLIFTDRPRVEILSSYVNMDGAASRAMLTAMLKEKNEDTEIGLLDRLSYNSVVTGMTLEKVEIINREPLKVIKLTAKSPTNGIVILSQNLSTRTITDGVIDFELRPKESVELISAHENLTSIEAPTLLIGIDQLLLTKKSLTLSKWDVSGIEIGFLNLPEEIRILVIFVAMISVLMAAVAILLSYFPILSPRSYANMLSRKDIVRSLDAFRVILERKSAGAVEISAFVADVTPRDGYVGGDNTK